MISISSAVGSRELLPLFNESAKLATIPFADFIFCGFNGKENPIIAIERKTVSDLTSSIISERLVGQQLPAMFDNAGTCYLMIEGKMECAKNGTVKGNYSKIAFDKLFKPLITLGEFLDLRIIYTFSEFDTVRKIEALYQYYKKPYSTHRSFFANHLNVPPVKKPISRITYLTRLLALIPFIGFVRASKISQQFDLHDFANYILHRDGFDITKIPGIGVSTKRQLDYFLNDVEKEKDENCLY